MKKPGADFSTSGFESVWLLQGHRWVNYPPSSLLSLPSRTLLALRLVDSKHGSDLTTAPSACQSCLQRATQNTVDNRQCFLVDRSSIEPGS